MQEIILLTTIPEKQFGFSEEIRRGRAAEFEQCLANNCKTDINRVIVFFEGREKAVSGYPSLAHEKVKVILIRERPELSLFFDYANEHLAGNFVIVGNADIYFDPNTPVNRIREISPGCLWALSRYNSGGRSGVWQLQPRKLVGSYDSYIFHAPLKRFKADFSVGIMGCDSCLVREAVDASVRVSNPCLSLMTKHWDHFFSSEYALGNREFKTANAYWKKPDWKFPCFYYWPAFSRIEDEDYVDRRSLRFIAATALCRRLGDRRVRSLNLAWIRLRGKVPSFYYIAAVALSRVIGRRRTRSLRHAWVRLRRKMPPFFRRR